MSRRLKQRKEAARRIEKRVDRVEDTKEGDLKGKLKPSDISKARSKSLSVASQKVLREEERSKTVDPGYSGYFRKKHGDSPALAHLPKDETAAKKFASSSLKAAPKPTAYWLEQQ